MFCKLRLLKTYNCASFISVRNPPSELAARSKMAQSKMAQTPFRARDCACWSNREILCLHCGDYVQKGPNNNKRIAFTSFHEANWEEEYEDVPDLSFCYKPNHLCQGCAKYLERRKKGETKRRYLVPAIFKKPLANHSNCLIKIVFEQVTKDLNLARYPAKIQYPSDSNLVRPVLNIVRPEDGEDDDVAEAVEQNLDEDDIESFSELCLEDEDDEDYLPEERPVKKQKVIKEPITQQQVNDLVKILGLSEDQAEVLASFFKRFSYTELSFRITHYRTATDQVKKFYKTVNNCVILHDIKGFVEQTLFFGNLP